MSFRISRNSCRQQQAEKHRETLDSPPAPKNCTPPSALVGDRPVVPQRVGYGGREKSALSGIRPNFDFASIPRAPYPSFTWQQKTRAQTTGTALRLSLAHTYTFPAAGSRLRVYGSATIFFLDLRFLYLRGAALDRRCPASCPLGQPGCRGGARERLQCCAGVASVLTGNVSKNIVSILNKIRAAPLSTTPCRHAEAVTFFRISKSLLLCMFLAQKW